MNEYEKRSRSRDAYGSSRADGARRTGKRSAGADDFVRDSYDETYRDGMGSRNEYCYEPPKKNAASKKGLNAALAVLCICAIAISSIVVGVSLLRDTIGDGDDSSVKTEKSSVSASDVSEISKALPQTAAEEPGSPC